MHPIAATDIRATPIAAEPVVGASTRPADEGLVIAARSGDRAAFARLYQELAPVVHGVLVSRLRARDADDLVQEVFVTVWRRLADLRDPAAFVAWVLAIARNAAATVARGGHPLAPLSDSMPAPGTAAPDAGECGRVLDAIRSLPDAYRETLTLRLVEGLTGPQIAACLGMTHGSVRVNLCRGMEILRERLRTDETTP